MVASASQAEASGQAASAGNAGRAMAARWQDCDPPAVQVGGGAGSSGGAPLDETAVLQALPAPCIATGLPRMAVIDVTVLRTEELMNNTIGINLLQGLSFVLSRARAITDTLTRVEGQPDARTVSIINTTARGTPQAGIAYSLNIANAMAERVQVVARPSLVALDRQPSTFFSGRSVTLGLAGTAGSMGTVVDRSIGVSLSVVPTFVSGDTMLLAVKATRSFLEPLDSAVGFSQSLQTSRNSVSANVVLKFDQTLILSGLSEQETIRVSNGVPVIQDVPLLQHLFRQRSDQTYARQVLVILTPRRPLAGAELQAELDRGTPPMAAGSIRANAATLPREQRGLSLQYRSSDIEPERWGSATRLPRLLSGLSRLPLEDKPFASRLDQ